MNRHGLPLLLCLALFSSDASAVEGQPLGANLLRVVQTMEYLGNPLPAPLVNDLEAAAKARDSDRLQQLIDAHVLLTVTINPEERVKVDRGSAKANLQQAGFTPILIKVANQSTATKRLRIDSPQAGPVFGGTSPNSLKRQDQIHLLPTSKADPGHFLAVEMFTDRPMTATLSGLEVEYVVGLIYSNEAGKREATLSFDIGQGTQDLGFRGQLPVLFDIRPGHQVALTIADFDGKPTTARLQFEDVQGTIYPPQARRLAPDLFFQKQIYRHDQEIVILPPGTFSMIYSRGPEYKVLKRQVSIGGKEPSEIEIKLERWIHPEEDGFYSGDHHIHGAGCAHYTDPTLGVRPEDMFRQVKGEGLHVGCVLTWGPCFDFQRQFFSPTVDGVSDDTTIMKYDLEISGFGSASLGHVCLLNLKDQVYPGSEGSKNKGWPTWTTPVMRWAKKQGGVTGYAHSASGLLIDPQAAATRLHKKWDQNDDNQLSTGETEGALLPEPFATIDDNGDKRLTLAELIASHQRAAEQLPNFAIPEMNGVGAMEICVSAVEGVCDFISTMDTQRIQELNTWYHLMNCGFPIVASGETDFPCMSSRRVGQGRVYVQLGEKGKLEFATWIKALAQGRSYVSDGFAHATKFTVRNVAPGFGTVALAKSAPVLVEAEVAFAPETPITVAQGLVNPPGGRAQIGDTVHLHGERNDGTQKGGHRLVELIVNGLVVAQQRVPADGKQHQLKFNPTIEKSSWVALRQFPQLHTNPVIVQVAGQPVRASAQSARWCREMTALLWQNRKMNISPTERPAAKIAFERTLKKLQQIESESD